MEQLTEVNFRFRIFLGVRNQKAAEHSFTHTAMKSSLSNT